MMSEELMKNYFCHEKRETKKKEKQAEKKLLKIGKRRNFVWTWKLAFAEHTQIEKIF